MSILNTTNATNFMLYIPDYGLTEATQMNIQTYKPPTIEIPFVDQPSGPFGKSRSMLAGTTFKYKPITFSVLVDRDLLVYREMYQWALAVVNYPEYYNREFEKVSDASLYVHILDNTKTKTIMIHEFTYPFPSLIYAPTYNHTASTDYPMVMNVEIKYHTFFVLDAQGNRVEYRPTIDDSRKEVYNELKQDYKESQGILLDGVKPKFDC